MGTVEVVLGRAGTGKSHSIGQAVAQEIAGSPFGPRIFWLVPSHASYATERMLLQHVKSTVRAEVLTLERFAQRVLAAASNTPLTRVNLTGKRLVLAGVYQQCMGQLKVLKREEPSIAFLDAILESFAEMTEQMVPLSSLQSWLETAAAAVRDLPGARTVRSGHSLLNKLQDLSLLYVKWKQALTDRGLMAPEDAMTQAQQSLAEWPDLKQAAVYIDGFTDMSRQQLALIAEIAQVADHTEIALSMDPHWAPFAQSQEDDWAENGLVHSGWTVPRKGLIELLDALPDPGAVYAPQTLGLFQAVLDACRLAKLPVSIRHMAPAQPPRFTNEKLAVIERAVYSDRQSDVGEISGVQLAAAQNPRAETDGVAREIRRRVQEAGLDFGSVAVVVPRLDDYAAYLRDSFERYEIPYYMDSFPSLATYPLAKFMLAMLQLVEEQFSLEAVVRLLKSDFCGVHTDDADWLEPYLRRYEVFGVEVWTDEKPWDFAQAHGTDRDSAQKLRADDERADRLRRQICAYAIPFYKAVETPWLAPFELAFAFWQLLQQVGAKRLVSYWMVNEDGLQTPLEASLHEQAWTRLTGLVNDLAETMPEGHRLYRGFLFQIVRSDMVQQGLATIPAGIGQVLVTELHRASAFEMQAVFVLGAVDGAMPQRVHAHGLLHDDEREGFAWLFGQRLGYSVEELQMCEQAHVYSALTRASGNLTVSYPLADAAGKVLRPALAVYRLRTLFPKLPENLWLDSVQGLQVPEETDIALKELTRFSVHHRWLALIALLRRMRDAGEVSTLVVFLLDWFLSNPDHQRRLDTVLAGLRHRTRVRSLGETLAAQLYGTPLTVNVHQLESYAACSFQHFARFGLRLAPEENPDITSAARGSLIHEVIREFVEQQRTTALTGQTTSDEAAVAAIEQALDKVLNTSPYAQWKSKATRMQQAEEVLQVLRIAAIVLSRHLRYGRFRPHAVELSFGEHPSDQLPAFELPLAKPYGLPVRVRGRIDRVDVAPSIPVSSLSWEADGFEGADDETGMDSLRAFRIIDYKSRDMKVDMYKVFYGLTLQLPLYAAVVKHFANELFGHPATPAGILYLPVRSQVEVAKAPEDPDEAQKAAVQKMKAKGVLVHHPTLIEWMDERLTNGIESDLFGKVYNQNGQLAKNAPALEPAQWDQLLEQAIAQAARVADGIQRGENEVSPFRFGPGQTACTFCSYSGLCQIDRRTDSLLYRNLEKMNKDEVFAKWQAAPVQGGDSHA